MGSVTIAIFQIILYKVWSPFSFSQNMIWLNETCVGKEDTKVQVYKNGNKNKNYLIVRSRQLSKKIVNTSEKHRHDKWDVLGH